MGNEFYYQTIHSAKQRDGDVMLCDKCGTIPMDSLITAADVTTRSNPL